MCGLCVRRCLTTLKMSIRPSVLTRSMAQFNAQKAPVRPMPALHGVCVCVCESICVCLTNAYTPHKCLYASQMPIRLTNAYIRLTNAYTPHKCLYASQMPIRLTNAYTPHKCLYHVHVHVHLCIFVCTYVCVCVCVGGGGGEVASNLLHFSYI